MKNNFLILLLFLFINNIYSVSLFDLNEKNLQSTITKAIDGDAESAYEVALYYEFNSDMADEDRITNTLYWLEIAAENDLSGKYMKELSSYFMGLGSENRIRALYWLYKSSEIGYSESTELIHGIYKKYNFKFADDKEYITFDRQRISYYEDGALRGSGNAAFLLVEYYRSQKNLEKSQYWSRIGSQNMNKQCIKLYIKYLKTISNKNEKCRIKFWDKKLKSMQ